MASFTLCSTPREQMLNDVFTTALEGGIGYWSRAQTYRWSDGDPDNPRAINEFSARIEDAQDEDFNPVTIDAEVIKRGIRKAWQDAQRHKDTMTEYQYAARRDLALGKYDELDYDADTADHIVQFGLFDEVVFG